MFNFLKSTHTKMEELKDEKGFDVLLELSESHPIVIFKHSNTCPTSARAYDKMKQALTDEVIPYKRTYLVIVQNSRRVSDYIEEKTGITHESPQVIVIKDGIAVYDASHGTIDPSLIPNYLS